VLKSTGAGLRSGGAGVQVGGARPLLQMTSPKSGGGSGGGSGATAGSHRGGSARETALRALAALLGASLSTASARATAAVDAIAAGLVRPTAPVLTRPAGFGWGFGAEVGSVEESLWEWASVATVLQAVWDEAVSSATNGGSASAGLIAAKSIGLSCVSPDFFNFRQVGSNQLIAKKIISNNTHDAKIMSNKSSSTQKT